GGLSGNMSFADNPGNLDQMVSGTGAENGIDPDGPTMGQLNAKPPWLDNFTVVYTGQVYTESGKIGFRENIDDVAYVKLNNEVIINDNSWNTLAQAQADLGAPGWYDIEIRFSNGGGGAGSITGIGFAVDPDGPGGQDWMAASNNISDVTLFRYGTREATPAITSAANVAGAVGKPFSYRILASSNPTSFGASGLPSWMSLDTATGEITGTPTATGTSTFKVFAYNQYAASIKDVTVNVIDLDNWKYSMDLQLKYQSTLLEDLTKPGQGSVTGSASHNDYPVAKAFDNRKNHNSGGRWLPNASGLPNVWIQYDMGTGKVVTDYTIEKGGNQDTRAAKDWTLQGSNDNSSWTTIDTVTGQTGWTNWQTRYFKVDTPGSYRYYKLVVSANNGATDYVSIAEIQLKGAVVYPGNGYLVDATKPGQGSVAASASNQQHPATRAFDDKGNDSNGRWLATAPTGSNPAWIRYDFTDAKKIVEYTVQAQSFQWNERAPKNWTLQGSNDNTNWTTLDTQSNQTGWTQWQKRTFTPSTVGNYRWYKLVIT
ncbi:MAG: hypothetical protein EBY62_09860, partial [Cellvibrionales bacterium]|nr:hypothetical protein [Cellvibrionales bacterium]